MQPDTPRLIQLLAGTLEGVIRAIKLPTHTGLGKIHEVLRVVQNSTGIQRRSKPGMLPQAARIAKIPLEIMRNIQMHFVGQADNLARRCNRLGIDIYKIDIPCAAQQIVLFEQRATQIGRQQAARGTALARNRVAGNF
jgi:hypothetical protein